MFCIKYKRKKISVKNNPKYLSIYLPTQSVSVLYLYYHAWQEMWASFIFRIWILILLSLYFPNISIETFKTENEGEH